MIGREAQSRIDKLSNERRSKIKEIEKHYTQLIDKLVFDDLGYKIGDVLRFNNNSNMDYRGYYEGVKDGDIILDICLADGTRKNRKFKIYYKRIKDNKNLSCY